MVIVINPLQRHLQKIPLTVNYKSTYLEDSCISLLRSCLDLNCEVIKKTDNSRYANGNDLKLVNMGPIALIITFETKTSSRRLLEDISHAQIVSLM